MECLSDSRNSARAATGDISHSVEGHPKFDWNILAGICRGDAAAKLPDIALEDLVWEKKALKSVV